MDEKLNIDTNTEVDSSTLDFFNEPDDKDKIDLTEKKDETIELDEEIEEPESETDTEEEKSEEEEELEALTGTFSRKNFVKDFPDAFKKYPQLERGYYASLKYREIFPDLEDAREASEKVEILDRYQEELTNGSSEGLFKSLKEQSPDKFAKLIDNYLPQLQRVDPKAYDHVITNVIKHTLFAATESAKDAEDKDLLTAAQILKEFVFGKAKLGPPSRFAQDKDPEIDNERKQLNQEKLETRQTDMNERIERTVKNTVEGLIDPKGTMTNYVKGKAIADTISLIDKVLNSDKTFQSQIKKLWEKAEKSNYSAQTLANIRTAHLNKRKELLPKAIRKIRNEALQGFGRGNNSPAPRRSSGPLPNNGTKSSSQNRGNIKSAKDIPKNMSTLDFFNSPE